MIHVVAPGLQTTVQDSGRAGLRDLGIGAGGAADACALRLANLLVGNDGHCAGLEIALAGPTLRFSRPTLVALRGAAFDAIVGDRAMPTDRPVWLAAGAQLALGGARRGLRAYLAIAGGVATRPRLGSRSTDLAARFGGWRGRALERGDELPVGVARGRLAALRKALDTSDTGFAAPGWWIAPVELPTAREPTELRIVSGDHFAILDVDSRARLCAATWRVGKDSNRMGLRLDGPALALAAPLELVSEGVVPGTVQLPPSGHPVVLGVDAQTIGGYPRIAHVIAADLDRLAQLPAGAAVRFVAVTREEAHDAWVARDREIARMAEAIRAKRIR